MVAKVLEKNQNVEKVRFADDYHGYPVSVTESSPAWFSLNQWLPARDKDQDFWWNVTGRQFAIMLHKAGYPVCRQYECLLFHYYVVVPRMGSGPSSKGTPLWNSFMTDDFSPVEYSWKWSNPGGRPEIRYCVEPIGSVAGTTRDLFNQLSMSELLRQLKEVMPDVDLEWFDHYACGFRPRVTDKVFTAEWGSSMYVGFEYQEQDIGIKAYYMPRSLSRVEDFFSHSYRDAIEGSKGAYEHGGMQSFETLVDFLKTDPDGSRLSMILLSIDCVEPKKSRVKVYMRTPGTSLDHVVAIMTMGGRIKAPSGAIEELKELWYSALNLNQDFPTSAELPLNSHYTSGIPFYFDIQPGKAMPDVKGYIPVRHYGKDDRSIAMGLTSFLERRGRTEYLDSYMEMLHGFASSRSIDEECGLQTFISFAFQKDGRLALTSYLSPQVYKTLQQAVEVNR